MGGRASPRADKKVLVSRLRACPCFAVSGLSARQGNGKPIPNFVTLPNCCRIRSYEFESQSQGRRTSLGRAEGIRSYEFSSPPVEGLPSLRQGWRVTPPFYATA